MIKNVGSKERYGRIVMGAASGLAAGLLPMSFAARLGFLLIGVAGVGTGMTQYCPVNHLLGIDRFHKSVTEKSDVASKKSVA